MFRKIINEAITRCGKQETLAEKVGVTPATLSRKINGETGWHEDEINVLIEISGGCAKCKQAQNKRINAYNEVIRAQLEYIEYFEKVQNV